MLSHTSFLHFYTCNIQYKQNIQTLHTDGTERYRNILGSYNTPFRKQKGLKIYEKMSKNIPLAL